MHPSLFIQQPLEKSQPVTIGSSTLPPMTPVWGAKFFVDTCLGGIALGHSHDERNVQSRESSSQHPTANGR